MKIILFIFKVLLILGVGRKLKKKRNFSNRTLYIEFERDRSVCLGATFGDGHTITQTFFEDNFLVCGSDIESKAIKNGWRFF